MKAIILARVSTERQNLEEQINDLKAMALKDGYKDVTVISNKESAIKNDEEHRLGLNTLKELITNNKDIKAVYVRELSRLGRREEVNLSVKNFLISHNVQLVIQDPSMRLLNTDGSVNQSAELLFSLFNTMAKQEMSQKALRFTQGKKLSVANGKTSTGRTTFGYNTNGEGYIQVNEKEADTVREIFQLYATGNQTLRGIYSYLKLQGKITRTFTSASGETNMIRTIIRNRQYIGETTGKTYHTHYPRIIDDELFNTCNALLDEHDKPKPNTKHLLITKGLVKCTCGRKMKALVASHCAFVCDKCGTTVSINVMETIGNIASQLLEIDYKSVSTDRVRNTKEARRNELLRQLNTIPNLKHRLNAAMDRAFNAFVDGSVNKEVFDKKTAELKEQLTKLENLEAATKMKLDELDNDDKLFNNIDQLDIREKAQKLIKDITVETVDKTRYITVRPNDDRINRYHFQYKMFTRFITLIEDGEPQATFQVERLFKRIRNVK